jgi:hypothetical protein
VGLAVVASGCGALERVRECEAMIASVNQGLEAVRLQLPDAGADAGAYGEISSIYEGVAKNIDAVEPTDAALQRAVASYKEVLERAAKHSHDYSQELARPTRSKAERKSKEARLKRIRTLAQSDLTRETSVVRKLNALCHPQ